ncbi:cyclophilin [Photobacterium kishitanii]|uniref:Peptidyl-prolyl cis-trans isomerase n=1 Tax=Photobacterium kishitanii TaxID=318456 RepID=A0AAX0YYJ3_9GAMM|nr:peptidylprolyl isomerase [Photobacterium kishitanii]KJG59932.1 cyclophilin [Photobacterium kishitanii]KJG63214.1 cyclophilin [Photobacterium kishitanii]KJG67779.1 cyclophilin [Photobacterium kishitanii]KJG71385.1 cyclophilin [Photobacterium kishitanii]PSX20267.1 cyclophilin [Photobacterium kishitanii]
MTTITLITNVGNIDISLNKQKAPVTVRNFIQYCRDGFYNDTIFHRVIAGFMIQGGGHSEDLIEKPTRDPIVNEANRGLKNTIGTIAMARTDAPHSATAQFFINLADNDFLDYTATTNSGWGYTVFGNVTTGMEVVNHIAQVNTTTTQGHDDVPCSAIIIKQVTITE